MFAQFTTSEGLRMTDSKKDIVTVYGKQVDLPSPLASLRDRYAAAAYTHDNLAILHFGRVDDFEGARAVLEFITAAVPSNARLSSGVLGNRFTVCMLSSVFDQLNND